MIDIPLEFARHCLGWKYATHHKGTNGAKARIKPTEDAFAGHSFVYTDIRKVLKYVHQWCGNHKKILEIELIEGQWFVTCSLKRACDKNLATALMMACAESATKK